MSGVHFLGIVMACIVSLWDEGLGARELRKHINCIKQNIRICVHYSFCNVVSIVVIHRVVVWRLVPSY